MSSIAAGAAVAPRRGPEPRPALVVLTVAAAAAAVYGMRRADPDLFGYLAYGRYFAQIGHPSAIDVFSYTCRSCTWIHFEWLAHVVLWTAFEWAGPPGLIALKCAVGAVCAWFLFRVVSLAGSAPAAWVPTYLLSLAIVGRFFLFRPQIFTFALFAFFVDTLWRYLAGSRGRVWLLPPATAVWANLHGGFVAGLGAIGLTAALSAARAWNERGPVRLHRTWQATRPLVVVLVACAASTLLNPQTWRLWTYLLTELTHDTNRRFIAEWMPLFRSGDTWSVVTTMLLVATTAIGTVAAERQRVTVLGIRPWQWLASCLPLAVMTVQSVRHVPILAIWAAPVAAAVARSMAGQSRGAAGTAWFALRACMVAPALLTVVVVLRDPAPRIALPPHVLGTTEPFGVVQYMKAAHLRGNAFVPLWWGSYVTWELFPDVLVSMDGRNVSLYPRDMVRDNLVFYSSDTVDPSAPARTGADYFLVPRDVPVSSRVRADAAWRLLFEDADASLFVRADERPAGPTPPATIRFARPATLEAPRPLAPAAR